jgi:hypothetical protein
MINRNLVKILLLIWQFPQVLLALPLSKMLRAEENQSDKYPGVKIFLHNCRFLGSFALGECIFYLAQPAGTVVFPAEMFRTLSHEYGHCRQSRILGPLYLPVVGLASAVCNNLWSRLMHGGWSYEKQTAWYYSRFPEKWADRLGGVERKEK